MVSFHFTMYTARLLFCKYYTTVEVLRSTTRCDQPRSYSAVVVLHSNSHGATARLLRNVVHVTIGYFQIVLQSCLTGTQAVGGHQ